MTTAIIEAPTTGPAAETVIADEEFVLDMRVVEASIPIPVLLCDTGDNCGSSCASACSSNAADPS